MSRLPIDTFVCADVHDLVPVGLAVLVTSCAFAGAVSSIRTLVCRQWCTPCVLHVTSGPGVNCYATGQFS